MPLPLLFVLLSACSLSWGLQLPDQLLKAEEELTPEEELKAEEEKPRVRRAYGPEHRHCSAGAKTRTGIIGGNVIDDSDKYPWLAWIGDDDGTGLAQFCGGTLISERVVLTAGHCVYNDDALESQVYVRLRVADFRDTPGIARSVIKWRRHPWFDKASLRHDIALLLLNASVPMDEAYPVTLADSSTQIASDERNATIVGWGSTDEECRMYDTSLRDATVPIGREGKTCSTPGSLKLREHEMNHSTQLCAGYYKGSMDYPGCGDSGGPLLTFDAAAGFTQVGFVSWSYGVPYPDVFTRVSYYRDWIDEEVKALTGGEDRTAVKRRIAEPVPQNPWGSADPALARRRGDGPAVSS